MIGQFGVGFYSAFMVADRVEVRTRKVGEKSGIQWMWNGLVNGFHLWRRYGLRWHDNWGFNNDSSADVRACNDSLLGSITR